MSSDVLCEAPGEHTANSLQRKKTVGFEGFWSGWLRMPLSVVLELNLRILEHPHLVGQFIQLTEEKMRQWMLKKIKPFPLVGFSIHLGGSDTSCLSDLSAPWGGSQMWHGQTKRTSGERVASAFLVSYMARLRPRRRGQKWSLCHHCP